MSEPSKYTPPSLLHVEAEVDRLAQENDRLFRDLAQAEADAAFFMSAFAEEQAIIAKQQSRIVQLKSEARTVQKQMADLFRRALAAEHGVIELAMEPSEKRAS